jgi:hypothetical protein
VKYKTEKDSEVIMVLIIMSLLSVFLCYKWGEWKNWKLYYPTILFYVVADFNHMLLTYNKELWSIKAFWNDTLADYIISLVIAPAIIILFLTHYPKRILKQVGYILLYVAVFTFIEYAAYVSGGITYDNGWNLAWTFFLYISAFVLLRLHYKRPLLAWLLFIVSVVVVKLCFDISLKSLP